MENPIKIHDLGGPPPIFLETPIWTLCNPLVSEPEALNRGETTQQDTLAVETGAELKMGEIYRHLWILFEDLQPTNQPTN